MWELIYLSQHFELGGGRSWQCMAIVMPDQLHNISLAFGCYQIILLGDACNQIKRCHSPMGT